MIMAGHVMHAPDLTLLPPAEWPAVARALAKKPEDRWPSCREFVAAVAASWSGGLSTTVPMEPVSANDEWATKIGASPQPLRARPWRRPVVVSIVAFLVLAPLLAWIFFTLSSMARDRNAGSSSSDNLLAAGATQKAEPAAVPAPRREVPAERPPPAGENGPEPAPVPKPPASPPTPVALSLAGLEDLSLEPGDGKVFDVEIRGAEKGDRVTLTLQGLPAGIRQEAIPGEPARHRFRLTADYATKDVAAPVTVLARAGDRSAEARFRVAVKAHQNSLGMAFVRIPAGRFRIGSPENDPEALGWEKPQHEVEMTQPFYLGRAEVTRGQFRRFVEATGYKTEAESDDKGGFGYDGQKRDFQANKKYSWRDPGFEQTDDHPVVNVSWNDAQKFCAWLGEQEGKRYRLPTEAEWEYGCRANTSTRFHSGDEGASLKDVANLRDAAAREQFGGLTTFTERDGYVFTAPVGTFKPNDFGLHDMHGNVAEWCADWHSLTYYRSSPAQDPPGPDGGTFRVIRGGSFFDSHRGVRAADRRRDLPAGRSYDVGFRVVAVR